MDVERMHGMWVHVLNIAISGHSSPRVFLPVPLRLRPATRNSGRAQLELASDLTLSARCCP